MNVRSLARTIRSAVAERGMSSFEASLRARVASLPRGTDIADGSVVFDAGASGKWVVRVRRGSFSVERGGARDATTRLFSDPRTFLEVIEGRAPGVRAFLDSHLFVRGSIAYALPCCRATSVRLARAASRSTASKGSTSRRVRATRVPARRRAVATG